MKRRIIKIKTELCNGCGICADACHEGAIGIHEGKAVLLRDDYCDGLGDCLPTCPTSAISFEEREALAFDKEAVEENMRKAGKLPSKEVKKEKLVVGESFSALTHWPVQLQLVSEEAEFLTHADLLIAADCCAYACGEFHAKFMQDKVTLVGCPKLDVAEYQEKLTHILEKHQCKSVLVTRMEVPCCSGLEFAVKKACESVGMTASVVTLTTTGEVKSET